MNSTGAEARSRGSFSVDSTVPGALPRGLDALRHVWETRLGDVFPLPNFSPATIGDFRVKSRGSKVRDVAITDIHGASVLRTASAPRGIEEQVRMLVVQRGAWTFSAPLDRREPALSAGQFLLRHVGQMSQFETAPHTTTKIIALPAAMLRPLFGSQASPGRRTRPRCAC